MKELKGFSSKQELLAYERERTKYYMERIISRHWIRDLILDTFHPKYRALRKKYDGYCGGWYEDLGMLHTLSPHFIPLDQIKEGQIVIQYSDGTFSELIAVFAKIKGGLWKIDTNSFLESYERLSVPVPQSMSFKF